MKKVSLLLIACCCLLAGNAAAQASQHAADSVFQQAMKLYGPRPGYTQTPDDIQHMKDALTARQQAFMQGGKDTPAPTTAPATASQSIPDAPPEPKGLSGMDYAHNAMFKKCRVSVSMSTALRDTASDAQAQSHSGSGINGTGTINMTTYKSDVMGRQVLVGGPDAITDLTVSGSMSSSGFEHSPNTNTSYQKQGIALSNPLPSVNFTYMSDTEWSASVTLHYTVSNSSNPSVVIDRTDITQDANPDNATLTQNHGVFTIKRKIAAHSDEAKYGRKEKKGEDGTFTITISPEL